MIFATAFYHGGGYQNGFLVVRKQGPQGPPFLLDMGWPLKEKVNHL